MDEVVARIVAPPSLSVRKLELFSQGTLNELHASQPSWCLEQTKL